MSQIIYPGSFDPITNGHIDVIERFQKLYDEVVVLIAHSNQKKTLFSAKERQQMILSLFKKNKNIKVDTWDGLLVDYCKKQNCFLVGKGLRSIKDFEYEKDMAQTNRKLNEKIETVFICTEPDLSFISSTLVKEVINFGGDISQFVPKSIASEIEKKIK
jgi:pantetheine-phosphate adenylyltransferase